MNSRREESQMIQRLVLPPPFARIALNKQRHVLPLQEVRDGA